MTSNFPLRRVWASLAALAVLTGCDATASAPAATDTAIAQDAANADAAGDAEGIDTAVVTPVEPEEYVATLEDFDCVKNGTKVGRFYVANRVSPELQAKAVEVAQQETPGGKFPVGTMLRLFPLEAFVKRGKGFEETDGWEVFLLNRDKKGALYIEQRGGLEVKNSAGSCFGCHAAAKDYDSICGTTHGCVPLGVSDDFITALQDVDPACGGK